jgi:outer membrane lipopolysaccharide assembly protein LptE/RlpB
VVRAIFVLFYVLFLFVDASIQSTELEEDSKYGKFRLKVKRRLLKSNPELKNLSKKEMQEELVRLYEDEMVRFRSIEKVAYERLRILIARVVTTE